MQFVTNAQAASVNAGARLDRLPICSFHWRILALIGAGMFLEAFDIYLLASLGSRAGSVNACPDRRSVSHCIGLGDEQRRV